MNMVAMVHVCIFHLKRCETFYRYYLPTSLCVCVCVGILPTYRYRYSHITPHTASKTIATLHPMSKYITSENFVVRYFFAVLLSLSSLSLSFSLCLPLSLFHFFPFLSLSSIQFHFIHFFSSILSNEIATKPTNQP